MRTIKSKKQRKDKLWSKAVFERSEGCCVYCGRHASDPCHIYPRRFLNTCYVVENGLSMCREHHILFDDSGVSGKKFRELIIKNIVTIKNYELLGEIKNGKKTCEECNFTEIK